MYVYMCVYVYMYMYMLNIFQTNVCSRRQRKRQNDIEYLEGKFVQNLTDFKGTIRRKKVFG